MRYIYKVKSTKYGMIFMVDIQAAKSKTWDEYKGELEKTYKTIDELSSVDRLDATVSILKAISLTQQLTVAWATKFNNIININGMKDAHLEEILLVLKDVSNMSVKAEIEISKHDFKDVDECIEIIENGDSYKMYG